MNINDLIQNFHFLRPNWLYVLPLILLPLLLVKYLNLKQNNSWRKICDAKLLASLENHSNSVINNKNNLILILLAWVTTILALAGPTWSMREVKSFNPNNAWVIALEVNSSMLENDVKPSRLEFAKFKIYDFLQKKPAGLFGLVVFSKEAFAVLPLTEDTATFKNMLPAIKPEIMPIDGENISAGLLQAKELFDNMPDTIGNVLLITDGHADTVAIKTAAKLAANDYPVSVLAIGKNADNISLQKLAKDGDGIYLTATGTDLDLNQLIKITQEKHTDFHNSTNKKVQSWIDQGYNLCFLLLFFTLFYFRRGNIALFPILFILPVNNSHASFNDNLSNKILLSKNQRALNYFNDKKYDKSQALFTDNNWQAAAAYKNKNYDVSQKVYIENKDYYNLGNALAQSGKISEAIQAYKLALESDSNNQDAEYNKKLLEKFLKDQENKDKKKEQNKDKEQDQNQDKNQDKKENKQEQDQQKPDDNKQEKNNKKDKKENDQQDGLPRSEADRNDENKKQQKQQQQKEVKLNQWLRNIPDDPEELLKNKFKYEYYKRLQGRG